jgi:hypothetical protein
MKTTYLVMEMFNTRTCNVDQRWTCCMKGKKHPPPPNIFFAPSCQCKSGLLPSIHPPKRITCFIRIVMLLNLKIVKLFPGLLWQISHLLIYTLRLNPTHNGPSFCVGMNHRKYIRIDITTLGRGHGHVCLEDGNSHISPFVNFVCQGKFTTSVPLTKVDISKQV